MKTLKDFGWCSNYDCCFERHEKELKQEAIKWVKELRRVNKTHTMDLREFTSYGSDSSSNSNVVRWIMHFFNITEEDLK